jgi:hypothetical protein
MTATIQLTEEQQLLLEFENCRDLHQRILIKRRANALGFRQLADDMMKRIIPPNTL